MDALREVKISYDSENTITITLFPEGEYESTMLSFDGVPYHLERIPKKDLIRKYVVDTDPDFDPHSDSDGYCYIIAPFSLSSSETHTTVEP